MIDRAVSDSSSFEMLRHASRWCACRAGVLESLPGGTFTTAEAHGSGIAGQAREIGRMQRLARPFCAAPQQGPGRRSPVSWTSLGLTLGAALGLYQYLQYTKRQNIQAALSKYDQQAGQAQVGGPFSLKDPSGRIFTDKDLHGEFSILYFGFTHCPDICPDELEKMAEALDIVEKTCGSKVQPVFITIDPDRDSPSLLNKYCREFHPRLLGLWGPMEDIRKVAKQYRVYFMKTNDSKDDYLVDHSIIMYFLDPDGKFVTFFGKSFTASQIAASICDHVKKWKDLHPDYKGGS